MLTRLIFCSIILKIYGLAPHPSHFRLVPLNFYTPDNRNDKYFDDNNYYGIRIGWVGSKPPVNSITIDNANNCISLQWANSGLFNPHKPDWDNKIWEYSFIDTKILSGINTITVGQWKYTINVPKYGEGADGMIIIGDPNIGPISRYSLGNADYVIKNTLLNLENQVPLVVWLGDIFYHDSPDSIITEIPKLININNGAVSGFNTYLHVGTQGNHDYSSNTACHNCIWNINKYNMLCVEDSRVSGSWVNYIMLSDGLKSFHDGLSEIYHRGCRVPFEYTLQVKVIGRTCLLLIDNAWHYDEVHINWNELFNKVKSYVDTLIVAGHWDMKHAGSKSSVNDWVTFLKRYFSKNIFGVQGHTHINKISNIQDNVIVTAGGNGFRGSGCDCSHTCIGCHCCCPTLYNNGKFIIGGWNNNELCAAKTINQ